MSVKIGQSWCFCYHYILQIIYFPSVRTGPIKISNLVCVIHKHFCSDFVSHMANIFIMRSALFYLFSFSFSLFSIFIQNSQRIFQNIYSVINEKLFIADRYSYWSLFMLAMYLYTHLPYFLSTHSTYSLSYWSFKNIRIKTHVKWWQITPRKKKKKN